MLGVLTQDYPVNLCYLDVRLDAVFEFFIILFWPELTDLSSCGPG